MRARISVILVSAWMLGGCTGEFRQCNVNADCASGVCRADGTCAPAGSDEVTPPGSGTPNPTGTDTPTPQGCQPDHNGEITEAEFVVATGVAVPYRIATNTAVTTASQSATWDLSGSFGNDSQQSIDLVDPSSEWFASTFPSASYAARLSGDSDLLGVFEKTSDGLYLLGVVSPSDGASRTQLTYATPIPMLSFPLSVGKTWNVTSDVSGEFEGTTIFATSESYTFEVDEAGTVITPIGSFETMRVRAELTRTVLATTTTVRTFAFATECYGTVARIVSQEGEQSVEFTDAAEVWRLGQ